MDKVSADPPSEGPAPLADPSILQFGIFCCAVMLVVVLAVAAAASH